MAFVLSVLSWVPSAWYYPPPRLGAQETSPPQAGNFGYEYDDPYAVDPGEGPSRLQPALPPANEEELRRSRAAAKARQEQAEKEPSRFNREFRLGLGFNLFIGIPVALELSSLQTGLKVPAPFLFSYLLTDVSPKGDAGYIFNNYYEFSLILHLMQNIEILLGVGYQSDSFTNPVQTIGAERDYGGKIDKRVATYAVQYQKDTVFYDLGLALSVPWVISGKTKTVLGLRASVGVAFGIVSKEVLGLARPSLPEKIAAFNTEPVPSYKIIDSFNLPKNDLVSRISVSVGGYFELIGLRLYAGYTLRFFPGKRYPEATYSIVQDYPVGAPLSYSSISFPQTKISHAFNISLHYFINPLELLGRRRAAGKLKKPMRGSPALRSRIG